MTSPSTNRTQHNLAVEQSAVAELLAISGYGVRGDHHPGPVNAATDHRLITTIRTERRPPVPVVPRMIRQPGRWMVDGGLWFQGQRNRERTVMHGHDAGGNNARR